MVFVEWACHTMSHHLVIKPILHMVENCIDYHSRKAYYDPPNIGMHALLLSEELCRQQVEAHNKPEP